jgi:hypothetical protein
MNLNGGEYDGVRLISEENLREIHAPQMIVPDTNELAADVVAFDEIGSWTYTLGWIATSYRGHHSLMHEGGYDGFSAFIAFVPAERIGVAILTNHSGTHLHYGTTFDIMDRLLGLEPRPWLERVRQWEEMARAAEEQGLKKLLSARVEGTTPSHSPEAYEGTYEHPAYGRITIEAEGDALAGDYNSTPATFEHYHYDVFKISLDLKVPAAFPASFTSDLMGTITSVSIQLEPMTKEIEFTRTEGA